MKKFCLSMLAASLLFTIFSAHAGNRAGAVTASVGAGYDFLSSQRLMDNAFVPYIGLGYNFTQRWGFEGLLGNFNTSFKKSVDVHRQISGLMLALDGVYHFSPSYQIIEPYVLAGAGIMGFNPNRNSANNEGAINAGLGAEFFLDKSIALRIEARDFYTIVGGKNDVFLNAGVTFLFGGC